MFLATIAALAGFGLSVGRVSSDALFFTLYGADHLPLMFALIALVLIPFSLAYAAFVDRLTPHRMFIHLLFAFGAMVGISWAMMLGKGTLGIALYFIAYGVISEILLTHFTHYVSSFFDAQQAKRLLPTVMAISRLGAIMGGVFLGVSGIATHHAALVWALCLAVALALIAWWHRGEPIHNPIKRGHATTPVQMVREGLMFSRQSRLVRITALGVFLLVLLLSVQEYLVGSIFAQHYPSEHQLMAFFGWFSAITNACVLVLQLVLFGRLLRRFGLKTMNLIYPFTTLLSFGLMTLSAGYLAAVLGRINTVGVLPGVRNTVAGFFFNALPGYMQGRAHALIAGLILPLGLLASALFLWLIPPDVPLEWVAGGGFVFAIALFWVKLKKNAAFGDSLVELISQSVFAKDGDTVAELGGLDQGTAFQLADHMRQTDSGVLALNYADMLESFAPDHAGVAMLRIYSDLPPKLQDQLLLRLARLKPSGWEDIVWQAAQQGDNHLTETTVRLLLATGFPAAVAQTETWLSVVHPRLRAGAAVGCIHGEANEFKPQARETLSLLLQSRYIDDRLAALGALAAMPHENFLPLIHPMLNDNNVRVQSFALDIWSDCFHDIDDEACEIIERSLNNPSYLVRAAAIRAASRLPFQEALKLDWLCRALRDSDYRVRRAGQKCAKAFMPKDYDVWIKALEQHGTHFDLHCVMITELAASDIENKASIMRRVCDWHVDNARKKLLIREHMIDLSMVDSSELRFLSQVLREEARRHLDTVLHILGCLDSGRHMSYIRAGLTSGDRYLWAQTMETAIQHKKEGRLFRDLAILYEAERDGEDLGGEPPGGSMALKIWLAWCQEFGSEWLSECARYCQGAKRLAQ